MSANPSREREILVEIAKIVQPMPFRGVPGTPSKEGLYIGVLDHKPYMVNMTASFAGNTIQGVGFPYNGQSARALMEHRIPIYWFGPFQNASEANHTFQLFSERLRVM